MMKYLLLVLIFMTACTHKGPSEWNEWVKKKEANYQEKFSSPSIEHHIYLEKEGDEFYIQKTNEGYRWTLSACETCHFKVTLMKDLKVNVGDKAGNESVELTPNKETQVGDDKNLFISAHPYPDENKVRVFIYNLAQENLAKKRKRSFYTYQEKEKFNGEFEWLKNQETVTISRSDGSTKEMKVVAKINYKNGDKFGALSVYDYGSKDDSYKEEQKIMLLYRDLSNGKKTYGAGRFLVIDLKKKLKDMKDKDSVLIDLNYSYNPPCAVSTGFHCPLPQDLVNHEVLAGEKYTKGG